MVLRDWKARLAPAAKEMGYRTGIHAGMFHRYPYMFRPAQLAFLIQCLEETRGIHGSIVEVGCAYGHTTVYLNEHLRDVGIDKRYICIDTFNGFTYEDVQHELGERGKTGHEDVYGTEFAANKKKWVERTLALNGADSVELHEADASTFDYDSISPIAFALVDVDLYRPVKAALHGIYAALAPNGLIVVDDCRQRVDVWDGATQAYNEFVDEQGLLRRVVLDKLGLLKKEDPPGGMDASIAEPVVDLRPPRARRTPRPLEADELH